MWKNTIPVTTLVLEQLHRVRVHRKCFISPSGTTCCSWYSNNSLIFKCNPILGLIKMSSSSKSRQLNTPRCASHTSLRYEFSQVSPHFSSHSAETTNHQGHCQLTLWFSLSTFHPGHRHRLVITPLLHAVPTLLLYFLWPSLSPLSENRKGFASDSIFTSMCNMICHVI